MTDQSPIDVANATIMNAEVQAISEFNAKYTAFLSDIQTIIATLGTGGPQTTARNFFTSIQGQLGPMLAPQLQNVLVQYGLVSVAPITAPLPTGALPTS